MAHATAGHSQAKAKPDDSPVEDIVITGSRVITNGFAAPTPVTVVTLDQMRQTAPNSLGDAVNQLPQIKSSFVSASTGFRNGAGDGGSFINLRGLGAKRGLVLLNGERVVQSQASSTVAGAVDLNVLPQNLVKRVDVVTGGATAAYGSDALSGAINFVLDTKFTGLKGEIRGGVTTYGDDRSLSLSLAYGRDFAGGRGHILVSGEHYETDGVVDFTDRPWANDSTASISTGATLPQTSLSTPTTIVASNVRRSSLASGGLVLTGATALRNSTFLTSAATLTAFPFGSYRTTSTMVGGGFDPDYGRYFSLLPQTRRDNLYLRASYDLTPDWTAHADFMYGRSKVEYRGLYQTSPAGGYTIFADNVYLTPALQALAKGPGATSAKLYNPATGQFNGATVSTFTIGRINTDWGFETQKSSFDMVRGSIGLDGKIGPWSVAAYYTHGQSNHSDASPGEVNNVRLYDALDAVASPGGSGLPIAGTPVCRSTLTNPGNGCVPLNVIGQNVANAQALAWIMAGSGPTLDQHLTQDVFDLSFHGEPFELWAGPVSFGAGATYRREEGHAEADAISESYLPAILNPLSPAFKPGLTPALTINGFPTALQGGRGGWSGFNPGGFKGSFNVKEVFAETLIPLAKDMVLAKSLSVSGAIRYAYYSTAGGQTNWKVGLVWEPVDGVRVRAARSKDIRAPNLYDLYGGVTQSNAQFNDPFRGNLLTQGALTISQGNTALKPEEGATTTAGVVFQPRAIPGLSLSVDYYSIKITNAIASPGTQTIVNQCYDGNTSFCSFITRDTANPGAYSVGPITTIINSQQNIGTTKQKGWDFEASYVLPLSRLFAKREDVLSFRLLLNHMYENSTFVVGATAITDLVGINGGGIAAGTGGNVDWQGSLSVNYQIGPLSLNWQERFIHGGKITATSDAAGNPNPKDAPVNPNATGNGQVPNWVPNYFYANVSATYGFGKDRKYQAFLVVSNLFNKAPPTQTGSAAFGYGVIPTNYTLYDTLGRNFTFGIRFKY
ncbi:MAG: TonB-dependent receptor [Sphingobium sp.]|nr:TonB-dependent receptor [Sphingobium sp.]